MPESDKALCIWLAEWSAGWQWQQVTNLKTNRLVSPAVIQEYPEWWRERKHGKNPDWSDEPYCGPAYDTDPVAALGLLGWLAKRGWSYICGWNQADGDWRFCRLWKHVEAPGPDGKRRHVITKHAVTESKAIALAADKVRESEEGDG